MSLDEEWQKLEIVTRGIAGNVTTRREYERATWAHRGAFVVVTIDYKELGEEPEHKQLWIPFSYVVEIRVQ